MRAQTSPPRRLHGQSVVEFALVSILILMLSFGVLDLGRAVFANAMVANATREASRYASVNPSDMTGMVAAAASTSSSLGLTASNFTFNGGTVSASPGSCTTSQSPALARLLAGDLLLLGGLVAKKEPTPTPGATTCQTGAYLQVCITYQFGLTAPRLIGLNTIPLQSCSKVPVQ
ncbi:MAG TPA: TadE family protein [Thermomicrobiales bacterium]|nr:TadE family protein [Thermomicrobiales bacterium]